MDGFYIFLPGGFQRLDGIDGDFRLVTPLFETTPWLVAPTPDAQRFLVAKRTGEEIPTPLTLVINWMAELER